MVDATLEKLLGAVFVVTAYADSQTLKKSQVERFNGVVGQTNGGMVASFKPVDVTGVVVKKNDVRLFALCPQIDDVLMALH